MDAAVVRLSIEVEANGAVRSVVVESEPGSGFGREAAQCARAKRFQPALDRNGTPVPGSSRVNVRFER
jgi:TonB family protein